MKCNLSDIRRRCAAAAVVCMTFCSLIVSAVVMAPSAAADTCYTWSRVLQTGASGTDVTQLQIRVAGWAAIRQVIPVDGKFGPITAAAVKRFQAAYGLHADGIAGPQTFAKIRGLQDADCTPIHFSYEEFKSHDGSGFSGGRVSARNVRQNLLRTMWKAEAVRHKLGDHPLTVVSGFRSIAHNSAVGGARNSQHLYGTAADLRGSGVSLCSIARAARTSGFSGILGPGAEGHSDHTHADSRAENRDDGIPDRFYWNAPSCF